MPDLSSYSSSDFVDIRNSIKHSKTNNLILANVSKKYEMDGVILQSPISVFGRYWGYIRSDLVNYTMGESDIYRPENVSKFLYGTRELAFLIKIINGVYSNKDFDTKVIKVIHPSRIGRVTEIIAANQAQIARFKEKPEKLQDLTIREVL